MIHYVYNQATNIQDLKLLSELLHTEKIVGLDTETNGLDPYENKVLLLQINVGGHTFVLDVGKLGKRLITNILNLINMQNILCIGHNIKFDIKMLQVYSGVLVQKLHDTMIIEAVLTSGLSGGRSSLSSLVKKYCNVELSKDSRLDFLTLDWDSSFTEEQINYSALDVLYLHDIYYRQIDSTVEAKLEKIVSLESRLLPIVAKMELEGITLDVAGWNSLTADARNQVTVLGDAMKDAIFSRIDTSVYSNAFDFANAVAIPVTTKRLRSTLESITDPVASLEWIKSAFNIGSHKQLLVALNLIGIDTPNTNEKTLNKLPKDDVIDIILQYREYEKRLSTYGDNVVEGINKVTGKIHADYNQVGTATGRFSSSGVVNMQNIPTHNGYRECFVAREGYSFISMDYSQQEYRLAGALSREEAIINAYKSGFDMHTASAANIYSKELKDVTKDERSRGKGINFTVLYGGTEWALGKNLNVPTAEAKDILNKFFSDYPRLSAYKTAIESLIVKLGYSITPMGRRRYFKPLPAFATPQEIENNINRMKREGFNMVIQGGGADVTKLALVDMDEHNPFKDLFIIVIQVHDEIVCEVHDSILTEAEDFMRKCMVNAFTPFLGEIPAVVDSKISKRWSK